MNDKELTDYILNRNYYCAMCRDLQNKVKTQGLIAIDEYDDMICSGVEDMKIRRAEIKTKPSKQVSEYERT